MKYILAVVIFGIIVLIHEFGHFITAKLCGIKVNQFSLGMGPALLKKNWGETEYSIRLFPVGGFCAMEGEDADSDNNRAFGKKPVWQRMIVIVAGAFMNLLLGFIIIVAMTCMEPKIPTTTVKSFNTADENGKITAKSYECGLREGDKIIRVNDLGVLTLKDVQYALLSAPEENYDLVVKRNGEKIKLDNVVFTKNNTTGALIDFYNMGVKKNPINVLAYSAKDTVSTARLVWVSIKDLVFGKYSIKDMSGPVGLVSAIGEAAGSGINIKESIISLMSLTALITINLGIMNLLPIPGLDGGRFLFLIVEAIRGKKVRPEHEGAVHLIGMAMIMLLILFVTFGDIKRLIG